MTTGNPRFDAWRRIHPTAPIYEYSAWLDRAKRFALEHGLGVRVVDGSARFYQEPHTTIYDHNLFSVACVAFAAMEIGR